MARGLLQFATDGASVLFGSSDKTVRLWDAVTGPELHRFVRHTSAVSAAVLSNDSRYALFGDGAGVLRLWLVPK